MRGIDIRNRVYDWLSERFPEGPEWAQPGFHCFRECPLPIRMIPAIDSLESEVSNGAWGQLLWNTLPNWQELLKTAKDGYLLIGATSHAFAVDELAVKLGNHAAACAAAQSEVTDAETFNRAFGQFTDAGYSDIKFSAQATIANSDSDAKLLAWLEANERVVLEALGV